MYNIHIYIYTHYIHVIMYMMTSVISSQLVFFTSAEPPLRMRLRSWSRNCHRRWLRTPHGIHRKTMGKPWENHRKTIGTWWLNGILWDFVGFTQPGGGQTVCELENGH